MKLTFERNGETRFEFIRLQKTGDVYLWRGPDRQRFKRRSEARDHCIKAMDALGWKLIEEWPK